MRIHRQSTVLFAILALATALGAGEAAAKADKWEDAIKAFEAADAKSFPAPGGNVFIGSSSIVKWSTLAQDLAPAPVIKRGFGGSQLADTLRYADRIIIPYKPKRVFVYAGDNDLAAKRTPEAVAKDFADLAEKIHQALPAAKVYWITVKPSPARAAILAQGAKTNALVKDYAGAHPQVTIVDVATPMLGADGQPRGELFGPDHLHMAPAGYVLWTSLIKPLLAD
jgi:lysophospholipase L1-like esterase